MLGETTWVLICSFSRHTRGCVNILHWNSRNLWLFLGLNPVCIHHKCATLYSYKRKIWAKETVHSRRTYDLKPGMTRWRTKLVLDFAYLLSYCQSLSRFFLLLEDDVVPVEVCNGGLQTTSMAS